MLFFQRDKGASNSKSAVRSLEHVHESGKLCLIDMWATPNTYPRLSTRNHGIYGTSRPTYSSATAWNRACETIKVADEYFELVAARSIGYHHLVEQHSTLKHPNADSAYPGQRCAPLCYWGEGLMELPVPSSRTCTSVYVDKSKPNAEKATLLKSPALVSKSKTWSKLLSMK